MEDARALGEREGVVGREAALLPGAVAIVADVAEISGLIGESQAAPVDVLLLHRHGELLCAVGIAAGPRP